ncbi:MAG TPA: type 4a pilus biogenesis protein PilO [Candidatus Angelobacter sp.]|nr:type 4a pilus biogenesis protein PilO [Candidatus Angelobacter sp.]
MAKTDDMSWLMKLGILVLIVGIGGGLFYYLVIGPLNADNKQLQMKVADKNAENDRLRQFEPKLAQLKLQIVELQRELDVQKQIVPDEKEADKFIKLLHDTGSAAGIELRRYTAMPVANKEFYTEVPFQIDIDGPYYSVMSFFDRIAKLDRIVNISTLQMSNTRTTGPAKVKMTYSYAPGETVVASCTATTFYTHDQTSAAPPAPKR